MTATFCMTFDYWVDALTGAFPILKARGLPGTFYVATESGAVDLIDYPGGGYPTSNQLADIQQNGWEIGIYSNTSMPVMLGTLSGTPPMAAPASALSTKKWMMMQKDKLKAKGFVAQSYAPNGRAWNIPLANLSRDIFESVRVCDDASGYQTYPGLDKNYVRRKAINSLGNSDTVASFQAEINNAMAAGATDNIICTWVCHKVGPVADPYTVETSVFAGMMDALVTARNNGARVLTFTQALTPP